MTPSNPSLALSVTQQTLSTLCLPATAATPLPNSHNKANSNPTTQNSIRVEPSHLVLPDHHAPPTSMPFDASAFDSPPRTPPHLVNPPLVSAPALSLSLMRHQFPATAPAMSTSTMGNLFTPLPSSSPIATPSPSKYHTADLHSPMDTDSNHSAAAAVQSTNLTSHLRASFKQVQVDRTGELVRLLCDIATITRCVSAYAAHDAPFLSSTPSPSSALSNSASAPSSTSFACKPRRRLNPNVATRHIYKSLSHDGYACAILDAHTKLPLTFSEQALHGGYVVALCSLDIRTNEDEDEDEDDDDYVECGTWFAVFRRKASPTVPGRLIDVQQQADDQVAAGYVLYSSTTRLVYTMRCGAPFSFNLHPVTHQYFMHPHAPLRLPKHISEEEKRRVWVDWSALRRLKCNVSKAVQQYVQKHNATVCNSGCFVADFDAAMRTGGVIIAFDVHLLCVAGPAALIVEEMKGKAMDGSGNRILDKGVIDDNIHARTCFVAGTGQIVDEIDGVKVGV